MIYDGSSHTVIENYAQGAGLGVAWGAMEWDGDAWDWKDTPPPPHYYTSSPWDDYYPGDEPQQERPDHRYRQQGPRQLASRRRQEDDETGDGGIDDEDDDDGGGGLRVYDDDDSAAGGAWDHEDYFSYDYGEEDEATLAEKAKKAKKEGSNDDDDIFCGCGGPPPPMFRIPPPPAPPFIIEDKGKKSKDSDEDFLQGRYPEEGDDPTVAEELRDGSSGRRVGGGVGGRGGGGDESQTGPGDEREEGEGGLGAVAAGGVEECNAPLPEDTCPALLVAGDAHYQGRLHPPVAALVVAAATLTFVVLVAALVIWRYRRQRGRGRPCKTRGEMSNGVIYEDLPSGPTPRVLPAAQHPGHPHAHAHDATHTLAPMELLDLKLSAHVHNTTYGGADSTTPTTLLPTHYSTHKLTSPTHSTSKGYALDMSRSSRNSQELYNPTYEEISTGSETSSVSSVSHSTEGAADVLRGDSPKDCDLLQGLESPLSTRPVGRGESLSAPCTCQGRRAQQQPQPQHQQQNHNTHHHHHHRRHHHSNHHNNHHNHHHHHHHNHKGSRTRRSRGSVSAGSTATTEGSEYHEGILPHLLGTTTPEGPDSPGSQHPPSSGGRQCPTPRMPRVPPPGLPLYTIQGTSDGRTSTSSSSDLPLERGVPGGGGGGGSGGGGGGVGPGGEVPLQCRGGGGGPPVGGRGQREPRYYVGVPAPQDGRSPLSPEGPVPNMRHFGHLHYTGDSIDGSSGASTSGGERLSPTDRGLPPLPSRSDRYRIFFSTDRRRGEGEGWRGNTKTLDLALGKKRNRKGEPKDKLENEPLYHEL